MATPKGKKRGTATSSFGVGKREGHDASDFYSRFSAPLLSEDEHVHGAVKGLTSSECFIGSSTEMSHLPDNSVGLVVTSPPYFVGKEYELAVTGEDASHIPTDYLEFLQMLREVFAECVRVLEPGGRIAVNVANLGRKPYRSLSADITTILQDDLALLMRGEIIWQKSKTSSGSCAWGSFAKATNPVLRDVTERVIVASKGRFSRAVPTKQRATQGLPHVSTITNDQFVDITKDLWEIDAESAKRVGHPAPFPIELPRRLIELFTYEGDIVVDPFCGSGTTLVAAERTGRIGIGYDLEHDYAMLANNRVANEIERTGRLRSAGAHSALSEGDIDLPSAETDSTPPEVSDIENGSTLSELSPEERQDHFTQRAVKEASKVLDIAVRRLNAAGLDFASGGAKIAGTGLSFAGRAVANRSDRFMVDVVGAFTTERPGLQRSEAALKLIGRATVLAASKHDVPLLVLTTSAPRPGSESDKLIRSVGPDLIFDVIELYDPEGFSRLQKYAADPQASPIAGYWKASDLRDS